MVMTVRTAVLVEGVSDQLALEALARRRGRNLEAEGVSIVPMGGATNIGTYLDRFGPRGLDLKVAGLCDEREEGDFRRGLERAGLGFNLTRADMERLGFFLCIADLEDELIRALGAAAAGFSSAAAAGSAAVADAATGSSAAALPRHPPRPQDPDGGPNGRGD